MKLRTILCLVVSCHAACAATPVIVTGQLADSVLGQATFTTATPNFTAAAFNAPRGSAVDPTTGKFYISDRNNNRVLRFSSTNAYLSGASAEQALGQTTTTSGAFNAASNSSMFHPGGLAFDNAGRLYVADTGFNRVLRFNAPSATNTSGIAANAILGQPDATTTTATIAAAGMNSPAAVAVGNGYLWVADSENNRVIGFSSPANAATGAAATRALGQANLTSKDIPATPTAASMDSPEGVTISSTGIIYVSDTDNNRVLRFAATPNTGASANLVLGQPDFATGTDPSSVTAANLYSPEGLVLDEGTASSLWVVDRVRDRVVRYDNVDNLANGASASVALGQLSLTAEGSNTTRRGLSSPYAIAIDTTSDTSPRTIWVADTDNNRVLRFTPTVPVPPAPTISGTKKYTTRKATLVIKGRATGAAGLAKVQYKGSKGGYKKAKGTTSWSFPAHLKVGKNRFTVSAVDVLGRTSSSLVITVIRK